VSIGQKKRGSLSRVKSTPKEEGGGDNPEPQDTPKEEKLCGSFDLDCALFLRDKQQN
jgi:hypothetical protein